MSKPREYIQIYASNESTGISYWMAKAQNIEPRTQYVLLHKTNYGVYIQYDHAAEFNLSPRVEYDIMRFKRLGTAKRILKNNGYNLVIEVNI